ncbi:MAG: serine/threonine-protein kinase [Calothrix sp. MO_167.B12]|nr:serine/threonine-protein kinase [Calothrix sp. MO_167.B12]
MYWYPGYKLHNGKYIIKDELGQGAFGITYKAVQNTRIQLPVVIKTPNSRLKRDRQYRRYVERFIQEAELLGQICQSPHPNIVRVIDYFEEGEGKTPCLVMEFIAGQDLYNLVENESNQPQPLPESAAVNYILQIGKALVEMHENSIVHRDIHPGNIMLRRDSEPILIDFGLAGDIAPASSFSKSWGNESFAPYEQMKGSKEPTVDIYGLAATLYYMVTSEYPTTSLDRKYHQANLVTPKQHQPRISEELNQAILAGMALEPEERPQTMQAWLNLLDSQSASGSISGGGDDLSSEVGVDYRRLRDLLQAGEWKQADKETLAVMLKASGREEERWLNTESIESFPCTDLRTIDQLWVKYSDGRFGFSVQKRVWESVVGENLHASYRKFGERVGWYYDGEGPFGGGEWGSISEVNFSTSAHEGHLPLCVRWGLGWGSTARGWGGFKSEFEPRVQTFFSRVQTSEV